MITAIVVAAGKGKRMSNKQSKPFLPLAGKPLLAWTLQSMAQSVVDNIIVVAQSEEVNKVTDLVNEYTVKKVTNVVPGGDQRQDSVANGLSFLPQDTQIVAIHDGARPLVKPQLINQVIKDLSDFDGAIPVVIPTDTIKKSADDFVETTLNRQQLRAVQTPQVFKKEPLLTSYAKAKEENFYSTDDASLLERYGCRIKLSEGSYDNIKVTRPVDLKLAEVLLKEHI